MARNDPFDKPQAAQKHPDRYERDLEPNHLAGQNIGVTTTLEEPHGCRASDVKDLVRLLHGDFTSDELAEISVLGPGGRLKQGATYLDLCGTRQPFTALGTEVVSDGSYVVNKHDCPYMYWNRLIGITDPERTT